MTSVLKSKGMILTEPRIFGEKAGKVLVLREKDGSAYPGKIYTKRIKIQSLHPNSSVPLSGTTVFYYTSDGRWFDCSGRLCPKPNVLEEVLEEDLEYNNEKDD